MPEMSEEHYALIGRIAVAAARLEHEVGILTDDLIDPDPKVSQVVTTNWQFPQRLRFCRDMAAQRLVRGHPDIDRAARLVDDASKAMQARNAILHGHWVEVGNEHGTTIGLATYARRKGGLDLKIYVDLSELEAALAELERVTTEWALLASGATEWSGAMEPMGERAWRRRDPRPKVNPARPGYVPEHNPASYE